MLKVGFFALFMVLLFGVVTESNSQVAYADDKAVAPPVNKETQKNGTNTSGPKETEAAKPVHQTEEAKSGADCRVR